MKAVKNFPPMNTSTFLLAGSLLNSTLSSVGINALVAIISIGMNTKKNIFIIPCLKEIAGFILLLLSLFLHPLFNGIN
jgi:hypothetical protein